ncbi:MAG: thioredoxin family protein [bacterium]
MKKLLKYFLIAIYLIIFLLVPNYVKAQEKEVNLYFFWSKSCPHCAKEKTFLEQIAPDFPSLKTHDFEVGIHNNAVLLQTIGEKLGVETAGVPITIIGRDYFVGYYNDEVTGKTILNLYEKYSKEGDPDLVGMIIREMDGSQNIPTSAVTPPSAISVPSNSITKMVTPTVTPTQKDALVQTDSVDKNVQIPDEIKVPFLGNIDIKNLSLPLITIILGALDGFNPCAMWTLLFLISLLLGMKDKKRRWILGTTFIATSALVYFMFMAAWLNLLLFVGFIIWVRIIIGILGLGCGTYNLKEYFTNKASGCKVTGNENRQKIFKKLRSITQQKKFLLALGGIILLAFAVNLVELICSAGLPVVFTQILTLSNLPKWQYYVYMLLYIFIFMLDDLFVFFSAMITLEMTGLSTKYSRASHLIGGVLMIIIGILIIFKPEILMFG